MNLPTWTIARGLILGLVATAFCAARVQAGAVLPEVEARALPRFTEEREAAALCFVKKHLAELVPLLEQLKKNNAKQYEHEVREIFQATEWLTDFQEDVKRYDLEMRIWKAENRAHILAAKLSSPIEEERKQLEGQLLALAKELVELDVQVLEVKADQLDKELGEVKDELAKARESGDKQIKERYEQLLEKAKKRRK